VSVCVVDCSQLYKALRDALSEKKISGLVSNWCVTPLISFDIQMQLLMLFCVSNESIALILVHIASLHCPHMTAYSVVRLLRNTSTRLA
jgi:hypothetical protein